MRSAYDYKTSFGLYKSVIKAIERLDGCARGWYFANAKDHSLNGLKDVALHDQIKMLIANAAPQTTDDLIERR